MANLHAFVTDALTECLKVLISLDSFNIFRAQPIQSIQNTTAEWKTATTASRSLNTVGEAQQSTYFKHYMHQQTSTNINIHQQNPMYTSTACWQRLSTRQGTAWPLHPTRSRGLLRQSALLTAVQTTEAKKHANSNKLTKPHTQQNATQKPSQCSQCSSERLPVTTRQQTEHERTWQNIIKTRKLLCRRAFWKPWWWWKSSRGLCRHLHGKKNNQSQPWQPTHIGPNRQ